MSLSSITFHVVCDTPECGHRVDVTLGALIMILPPEKLVSSINEKLMSDEIGWRTKNGQEFCPTCWRKG